MTDRPDAPRHAASLREVAVAWGRIGLTGFGGPPALLALTRRLCVVDHGWVSEAEFEDAVASASLIPGPAALQVAIFCAWKARGWLGGLIGGVCFTLPGLVLILGLAAVFLGEHPPLLVLGAAAGAGAAVPAVAVDAALKLVPASWARIGAARAQRARWIGYTAAGAAAVALVGPYLVLVLLTCGLIEVLVRTSGQPHSGEGRGLAAVLPPLVAGGALAGLAWTAFKVGALAYGGGFVIVPLMQSDAVSVHHWMTSGQFLTAVALGQITPGPVVQTVAVVGYAAAGLTGGLLAAVVAFAPSFVFVLGGASRFYAVRRDRHAQAFLTGAGPATIGAIAGSAIPLGLSLSHVWQAGVLAGAALWLFGARKGVVSTLLLALVAGIVLVALGLPA